MTPEEYIAALDGERRDDVARLDALIRATLPRLEPHVASDMLAYGRFHYRYASGREGDWFHVGLASHKQSISLHVVAACEDGTYLAERYAGRLPRADVGKSCVRFKRLDDVDLDVIRELLAESASLTPAGAA